MTGGLFDPLGTTERTARPSMPSLTAAAIIAGLAFAGLATLIAVAYLRDGGDRGAPRAVSTIEHVAPPPKPPPVVPPPPGPASAGSPSLAAGLPAARDDQEVEIQNGVRIIRPRRDHAPSSGQTLAVPDAATTSPPVRR